MDTSVTSYANQDWMTATSFAPPPLRVKDDVCMLRRDYVVGRNATLAQLLALHGLGWADVVQLWLHFSLLSVIAIVYGALFLGERVTLWMLLCGAVVVLSTALATGMTSLSLGSDLAGSIRLPAGFPPLRLTCLAGPSTPRSRSTFSSCWS